MYVCMCVLCDTRDSIGKQNTSWLPGPCSDNGESKAHLLHLTSAPFMPSGVEYQVAGELSLGPCVWKCRPCLSLESGILLLSCWSLPYTEGAGIIGGLTCSDSQCRFLASWVMLTYCSGHVYSKSAVVLQWFSPPWDFWCTNINESYNTVCAVAGDGHNHPWNWFHLHLKFLNHWLASPVELLHFGISCSIV